MPVFYECQRCTACCRWPGEVKVTEAETDRMAAHLGLEVAGFIERYLRLRADRKGLALQEQPGGACVFLDGVDCRVQAVKPQQCRDFPNLWNFQGFERFCRAIPRVLETTEYEARVRLATGRTGVVPGQDSG